MTLLMQFVYRTVVLARLLMPDRLFGATLQTFPEYFSTPRILKGPMSPLPDEL